MTEIAGDIVEVSRHEDSAVFRRKNSVCPIVFKTAKCAAPFDLSLGIEFHYQGVDEIIHLVWVFCAPHSDKSSILSFDYRIEAIRIGSSKGFGPLCM
jgi:hypothetical protein